MERGLLRRSNKTSQESAENRVFRSTIQDGVQDDKKEGFRSPRFSTPAFRHHEAGNNMIFWLAVFASQVIGLVFIGLLIYWCHLYGGFSWNNDANQQFFWHPFLMVLGLIFFYGDSIIIYRAFSFLPKRILKILHAAIHVCAIVASSVGLAAVLLNHKRTNKADFYSLHSWVGIGTFGFFILQYISGFIAFLYPGIKPILRAKILPYHTFFGTALFVMAVGSAQMGLTEKLLWTRTYSDGLHPIEGVVGNVIGLLLIIFAFLIIFIVTHGGFRRKPLPSEVPSQTSLN